MMAGGPGHAAIAFNQKDGSVVWKKHAFQNSTSSPIIINVDGQDHLVAFMYGEVVGGDPDNGDLLWSHPHPVDFGLDTSTPVWGEDNLLFLSWTVPALAGTTLYVRDRQRVMALDLK